MFRIRYLHPAHLVVAILMATTVMLAVPQAANAYPCCGPPCYGPSCVGKSPYIANRQGTSCVNDAVDLLPSADAPGDGHNNNTVTVRWSNYCHANWVRWTGPNVGYADYWAESWNGHREPPQGWYTNMVDGTQLARGVVVAYTFNASYCPNECGYTRWF